MHKEGAEALFILYNLLHQLVSAYKKLRATRSFLFRFTALRLFLRPVYVGLTVIGNAVGLF